MEIRQLMFTHSDCYKRNLDKADSRYTRFQERGPQGVMIHSTGANNPNLRRYIGPDDGVLGENDYDNHWNQPGLEVCVHGFIGRDKHGKVRMYQTLPWNFRGWHCGRSGNDTHVSIEICEDGLDNRAYLNQCLNLAAEVTAEICKEYGLDPMKKGVVIDHAEGHAMDIASNHGDITLWLKKHGKSMNDFRRLVAEKMKKQEEKEMTKEEIEQLVDVKMDQLMSAKGTGNSHHDYADEAIKWAVDNELVRGHENGDFGWTKPLTVERFVTILFRLVKRLGLRLSAK